MTWVLVLHISALLLWCAALLYLPVLMVGVAAGSTEVHRVHKSGDTVERLLFTRVATPAALVAIMSGTLVFLVNRTVDGWLIAKLTLVVALVVTHILTGLVVVRATTIDGELGRDRVPYNRPVTLHCLLLVTAQAILITAILWMVLAKPTVVPVP